jgi:uncharacterized protein YndB with AHSA1/START domain
MEPPAASGRGGVTSRVTGRSNAGNGGGGVVGGPDNSPNKPDKVYRAFTTANAMARWLPPNGFTCTVHEMDSKVGGTYRMSFINFTTGRAHTFGGKYLDLVPDELIRYTDRFEDPNLLGEMITTVTLRPVSVGTEVNIVREGLPAAIPLEACYLGWQQSFNHLATLVEPEIKD